METGWFVFLPPLEQNLERLQHKVHRGNREAFGGRDEAYGAAAPSIGHHGSEECSRAQAEADFLRPGAVWGTCLSR